MKTVGAVVFVLSLVALLGIVGAVENGAELGRMICCLPDMAVMAVSVRLMGAK